MNNERTGKSRRFDILIPPGRRLAAVVLGFIATFLAVAAANAASPEFAASAKALSIASAGNWLVDLLDDPTIAYVLLSLGMFGIFLEVAAPGGMLPGLFGVGF